MIAGRDELLTEGRLGSRFRGRKGLPGGNGPCIRCPAPDDTEPRHRFTRTAKVAGIPVGLPSDLPKAWFAAAASLPQAATPPRIARKCRGGPERRGALCREACDVTATPHGERVAALIPAVANRADHPIQFALFAMPDFTPPADAAHARHGEGSARRAALAARARLPRIMGLLAGKWPQMLAIRPGGVTRAPSLRGFRRDLGDHPFGAPVKACAALGPTDARMGWGEASHPLAGRTDPDADMREAAHAWCKAPRRAGSPMQTGVIARQVNDGHPLAQEPARERGVLARVAGRPLERARRQPVIEALVFGIRPEERFSDHGALPAEARGEKLVEAARGVPGHGLRVEKRPIAFCRIVAPTGWNLGLRDAAGVPGPPEAAPEGAETAPEETRPLSLPHILRSFDPCMAGTVH